jgi:hypothetical protein
MKNCINNLAESTSNTPKNSKLKERVIAKKLLNYKHKSKNSTKLSKKKKRKKLKSSKKPVRLRKKKERRR